MRQQIFLQQKDKLVEQEVEINMVRKRNIVLKEEKLKLEIELLNKKKLMV